MAETFTFTIKPITDLSDVKANVGEIQRAFSKLKLPDNISGKLTNEIAKFDKAYATVQKKMAEGIKTPGDLTQLQKNNNVLLNSWNEIIKVIREVSGMDLSGVLRFDTQNIKQAEQELAKLEDKLNKISLTQAKSNKLSNAIEKVQGQSKSQTVQTYTKNMLDGLEEKNFRKVFDNFNLLQQHYSKFKNMFGAGMKTPMNELAAAIKTTTGASGDLTQQIGAAAQRVEELKAQELLAASTALKNGADSYEELGHVVRGTTAQIEDASKAELEFNRNVSNLENQVESYFGLNAIFRTVANMAREAMQTVKELDAAMTETAVVTNFSVGDMWGKLPLYTAEANKLGSSIKDVYEATTLYYQQGLNTTQSMGLAVETLKMARIAGMDAKDATDAMTAALRGFNLELNQASAQRINDVYSELAAITASDTQEISTAMEKVASLAHNAGMEVETTSAFLAQMIETTREAPENLGTALKTVIARFQEMKEDPTKLVDSEGVMLDANKVDKALKSIGVNLMDTNGQFRKLDDVFLEISAKWDTLTMGQQRYIATMAAGSRQQSRFIAMMSDYSRTMELVDAAYDSSGASQRQFEKTLESMDAKLNKLKNAWDQFIMGLMNNNLLKGLVDFGTGFLTTVNKIIDGLASFTGPAKDITKTLLTLGATFGGLTAARSLLKGGISVGARWFGGKDFENSVRDKIGMPQKDVAAEGFKAGQIWKKAFQQGLNSEPLVLSPDISTASKATFGDKLAINKSIYQEAYRNNVSKALSSKGYGHVGELFEEKNPEALKQLKEGFSGVTADANKFGNAMNTAGFALSTFGDLLQQTPLAPFGKAISALGGTLTQVSMIAVTGVKTASGQIVFGFSAIKAAAASALTTILPIIVAIGALVLVGKAIYDEFTREKREMETLATAASVTSDTFDNLKTATEELKNSIQEIRDQDNTFDNLTVGTTEWNQALVEANQQVLDLIHKYDILRNYVTTDENGRMHISEEGFKKVTEQQLQNQNNAMAIQMIKNTQYNNKLLEQEQNKLFEEQGINVQKFDRTVRHGRDRVTLKASDSRKRAYASLDQEAKEDYDNIQAKIDADNAASYKEAMRAMLATSGEINDTILNVFGQNLDSIAESFKNETDMSKIKQVWADATGGIYDELTGKLTDVSGEDVTDSLDDATLKEIYPYLAGLLQFQNDAPKVESAVKSLSNSFKGLFDEPLKGQTFIDDLLNNNLDIDLSALEDFSNMETDEITELLQNMSQEEVDAILQTKDAEFSELAEKLQENAENLRQAQVKLTSTTATWYAKIVKKWSASVAGSNAGMLAKTIQQQLTISSRQTINEFMNEISQGLDTLNASTMGNNLFDALLGQPEEVQAEINELVNSVDWSSAIDRGLFYAQYEEGTEAYKGLSKNARKFVKEQQKVDKSVDLTGKQFQELVQSSDFLEILTNKWSDFADESGSIDSSGIEKMADECGTLRDVLDLAEFDAHSLATALNYFQDTGSFDGINSATLAAIKEFNQLEKAIDDVQKEVEGFEPGANYEVGIESYQDSVKNLKENWEKGYYSTGETQSYITRLIGEDNWNELYKNAGSKKAAEKQFLDNSPLAEETVKKTNRRILESIMNGVDITGQKLTEQINDEFTITQLDNGHLRWDFGSMDFEELTESLMNRLKVTEDIAKGIATGLIGTDTGYYRDNAELDIKRNGRIGGAQEYLKAAEEMGVTLGKNGALVMSEAAQDLLLKEGGYLEDPEIENKEEAIKALQDDFILAQQTYNEEYGKELGFTIESLQTFNSEAETLDDYLDAKYGKDKSNPNKGINELFDLDKNKGVANFDNALQELQADGYDYSKALQLAIDKAKELDLEKVLFDGQEIDLEKVMDLDSFNEVVEEAKDMAHWDDIGETIGRAVERVLKGEEEGRVVESTSREPARPTKDKIQQVEYNVSVNGENGNVHQQTVKLNVEKTAAEKNIASIQTQIDNLNKDIEQKRVSGVDTSDLERQLKTLNLQLLTEMNRLDSIDTKLTKLNGKQVTINFKSNNSLPAIQGHTEAKGKNNHISRAGFYAGSSARGRYGTVGPKNKGGLTLTGEKGFEIAWLPSENRSMIVGATGPQMLNLPSDAVVYSHEQSKKIIKQKSIPAGSHAGDQEDDSSTGTGTGKGKGKDKTPKSSDSKKEIKAIDYWYKTEIKRFNWVQKINDIVKDIEDSSREIDKTINKIGTKYEDVEKLIKEQNKQYEQQITTQKEVRKSYSNELKKLNGTYKNKEGKKESRVLHFDRINSKGESVQKSIKTSKFITNKNGQYEIDREAIEKYFKANPKTYGKEGTERYKQNIKAFIDMLTGAINTAQSGFEGADKAIQEAQDKIEENNQKLADWEPNLPYENFDKEIVKRWNIEQQINKVSEAIAKDAEKLEKIFDDITAKWGKISKAYERQYEDLQKLKSLAESNKADALAEGKDFYTKRKTSLIVDYTTDSSASKHTTIDPGKFISGSAKGFVLDEKELRQWMENKGIFGEGEWFEANFQSIAQTIMDKGSEITDRYWEAENSISDVNSQIEDLNKQLVDAFVGWKNPLTDIYLLSNQIARVETQTKTNQTQMKSLVNEIALGLISMSEGLQKIHDTAFDYIKLLEKQKDLKVQELEAQRKENDRLSSFKDEEQRYQDANRRLVDLIASGASKADITRQEGIVNEAKEDLFIAREARKLIITDTNGNKIIDSKKFQDFLNNPNLTNAQRDAITDLTKQILESDKTAFDLENSILDLDVQIQELEKQSDKTLADFEKELASALEAQVQKQIDSMESLDQSLDNAAQSILEQARQTLDARRQANQNQQTETDINNKEQRLAALRANTAGGNQVEIAQLEKEIVQDRQAYQESLEDQLLDRISKQNDDAKKQRELQIQIARQQLEYDKSQGKFMEQADELIANRNDEATQQQIRDLLKGDEALGEFGTKVQNEDFDTKMSNIESSLATIAGIGDEREKGNISTGIPTTENSDSTTEDKQAITVEEANKRIEKLVDEKVKAVEDDRAAQAELDAAERDLKKAKGDYKKALDALEEAKATGNAKKIASAEKEAYKAETNKKEKQNKYEAAQSKATATAAARETAVSTAKEAWQANSLTGETHAHGRLNRLPYRELKKDKGEITQLKKGLNDLINDGFLTGVKKLNDKDTYGEASHAAVKALQSAMGVPQTGIWDEATAQKLKHHSQFKYYRTGGLATSTGPAWLDGTASKPELVLNAVDTKNFIALKDILREVMRDISHVGASNDITNMAPTEFNININVDKIANDYDVDKLAARIKKDIVKDASYRNVTSIRHLR